MPHFKAGDLIAISGKAPMSLGIQLSTVSLPNIGPLGRWGMAGISHVGVICEVFGSPLVYESTSFGRPPCLRTEDSEPRGVQVHYVSDLIDAGGDVWHYPLKRVLYPEESIRLLNVLEECLGKPYDYFGAAKAYGGILRWAARTLVSRDNPASFFCSELVVHAWTQTGLMHSRSAEIWNPNRLVRYAVRQGICETGTLLG